MCPWFNSKRHHSSFHQPGFSARRPGFFVPCIREPWVQGTLAQSSEAMHSISTRAFLGSVLTAMAERAGNGCEKNWA